jgi:RHS repeat-associated protein
VVDDKGKVLTRTEYLPFGETWFQEGEKGNKPKFNSQELDEETNFYFYNARYYDPQIARFITADNIIPNELNTQSWNRYSYVLNNPIMYNDPTGHKEERSGLWAVGDWLNEKFGGESKLSKAGAELGNRGQEVTKTLSKAADPLHRLGEKAQANPKVALAVGLGGGISIAAAPLAGLSKTFDSAFGAVQGLISYGATTPKEEWSLKGASISIAVGAGTGLVGNFFSASKIVKEAKPIVKITGSGLIGAGGNFAGQVASGKELKNISTPSILWSGVTSGFGSYLGGSTNLSDFGKGLVGKGSMLVPKVSGAVMIKETEKQLKKD